jgi:hypothetical protein
VPPGGGREGVLKEDPVDHPVIIGIRRAVGPLIGIAAEIAIDLASQLFKVASIP